MAVEFLPLRRVRPVTVSRVAIALVAAMLGCCGSAQASGPFVWGSAGTVGASGVTGVACPSISFCVAADRGGDVLVSSDPTGAMGGWRTVVVDRPNAISAIACPSRSACFAVDGAGNVLQSADPGGDAGAWTIARVDTGTAEVSSGYGLLQAISCPSVSLCAAVDSIGYAIASSAPTGGPSSWTATHIDNGINYECYHYGGTGPGCQAALRDISCPAASLCEAVDDSGNTLTSTDPFDASPSWTGSSPYTAVPVSNATVALSCPTVSLCVGVDAYGGDVITWDPSQPATPPTRTALNTTSGLFGVSCQSASLCVVADAGPSLWLSTDPAARARAWTIAPSISNALGASTVTRVSCPSPTACIAVTADGNVIAGASSTQLRTRLRGIATAASHSAVRAILHAGGSKAAFAAPLPGRLTITWSQQAGRGRPTLIASGAVTYKDASRKTIAIRLTRAGQRLPKVRSQLTATASFTPANGLKLTVAATFALSP